MKRRDWRGLALITAATAFWLAGSKFWVPTDSEELAGSKKDRHWDVTPFIQTRVAQNTTSTIFAKQGSEQPKITPTPETKNETVTPAIPHEFKHAEDASAKAKKIADEKKKKKKKVRANQPPKVIASPTPPTSTNSDTSPRRENAPIPVQAQAPAKPVLPPVASPTIPSEQVGKNSLAYWKPLVVDQANANNAQQLIADYKNGVVKADVFYQVVAEMLTATPSVKDLAVFALAQTASARSFLELGKVMESRQNPEPLRQTVWREMQEYSNIGKIGHLKNVIGGDSSDYISGLAIQVLQKSMQQYFAAQISPVNPQIPENRDPKNRPGRGVPGTEGYLPSRTVSHRMLVQVFQPYIGIMRTRLRSESGTELASVLNGTIDQLETYLRRQNVA